ncbi:MAG TPA: peptidylprolyl isomerase [Fibrobacter sp.]|nr:peptidylprolyl isomerase [Fibrobacter sp.]
MKIAPNSVVSMHYTLTSDEGATIDSSAGREPLEYIQGQRMIVPGLEKAMEGHSAGEKFDVKVSPAEGYGERNDSAVQEIPLTAFQGAEKVEAGMSFYAQTPAGPMPLTVVKVSETHATVDANHQLAGKNLNFAIEVISVREATEEDLKALNQHRDSSCGDDDCGCDDGCGCGDSCGCDSDDDDMGESSCGCSAVDR